MSTEDIVNEVLSRLAKENKARETKAQGCGIKEPKSKPEKTKQVKAGKVKADKPKKEKKGGAINVSEITDIINKQQNTSDKRVYNKDTKMAGGRICKGGKCMDCGGGNIMIPKQQRQMSEGQKAWIDYANAVSGLPELQGMGRAGSMKIAKSLRDSGMPLKKVKAGCLVKAGILGTGDTTYSQRAALKDKPEMPNL